MNKPREFWIKKLIGSGGDVLTAETREWWNELREDGYNSLPMENYIHVIEKSAYDKLEQETVNLKAETAAAVEALKFYAEGEEDSGKKAYETLARLKETI